MQVNMFEAKSQLSKLAAKVLEDGETIVIAKAGKPMVDLVPHQDSTPRMPGGYDIDMTGFDEADESIAAMFEGA